MKDTQGKTHRGHVGDAHRPRARLLLRDVGELLRAVGHRRVEHRDERRNGALLRNLRLRVGKWVHRAGSRHTLCLPKQSLCSAKAPMHTWLTQY